MIHMLKLALQILMCVCLIAATAFAQGEIGGASLNGTVTDSSGAAVPAAKVAATNPATGPPRTTATDQTGPCPFQQLPVGSYDLTIEAKGFKVSKRTGVSLTVGAVATVDIPLEIGTAQETVSVTAEVPVVETTRSQTSTTITTKQVGDLPINGRNFLDFTVLTPGVLRDPSRTGDLSFGGPRGPANSVLVDGSDTNNVFFGQSTPPPRP